MASSATPTQDGDLTPWWNFKQSGRAAPRSLTKFPGGVELHVRAYLGRGAPELQDGWMGATKLGTGAHAARVASLTPTGELALYDFEEVWDAITLGAGEAESLSNLAKGARDGTRFFSKDESRGGIVRVAKSLPAKNLKKQVVKKNAIVERVFVDAVTVMRLVFSRYGSDAVQAGAYTRPLFSST